MKQFVEPLGGLYFINSYLRRRLLLETDVIAVSSILYVPHRKKKHKKHAEKFAVKGRPYNIILSVTANYNTGNFSSICNSPKGILLPRGRVTTAHNFMDIYHLLFLAYVVLLSYNVTAFSHSRVGFTFLANTCINTSHAVRTTPLHVNVLY